MELCASIRKTRWKFSLARELTFQDKGKQNVRKGWSWILMGGGERREGREARRGEERRGEARRGTESRGEVRRGGVVQPTFTWLARRLL